MSVQLIAWAYEQRVGSPTKKSVLLALANAANHHTGRCHPTIARLALETELSERAVRQALADLCEQGVISRTRPARADGTLATYRYRFPTGHRVRWTSAGAAHPAAPPAGSPAAPPAAQEPEVNLEPEELLAAAPRTRPRNGIWDALTEVFGDATTETARTRRGKVCRSLTAAHATPDEILRRARSWPRHFDDATLTDLALEKHWDVLGRKPLRVTR